MSELTKNQEEFARQMVLTNGNATQAAINAGYSASSAAQRAYELRQLPHVQAAVTREQRRALQGLASLALSQAKAMLENDATPAGARVQLIQLVLDRGGLPTQRTDEQLDGEQKSLREMSMDELQAIAASLRERRAAEA